MGCDIHLYVERQIDGEWESLHPGDVGLAPERWDYDGRWFSDRNYPLFAVLANVRNGRGIQPISHPRGLPDDVAFFAKAGAAEWDTDGHSHSWLMLGEVTGYRWEDAAALTPEWRGWPGDRWSDVIDALATLDVPVRLVFWFDN